MRQTVTQIFNLPIVSLFLEPKIDGEGCMNCLDLEDVCPNRLHVMKHSHTTERNTI